MVVFEWTRGKKLLQYGRDYNNNESFGECTRPTLNIINKDI